MRSILIALMLLSCSSVDASVLTLNVREPMEGGTRDSWSYRAPQIERYLAEQAPNLVTLQEITFQHQMEVVARALPQHRIAVDYDTGVLIAWNLGEGRPERFRLPSTIYERGGVLVELDGIAFIGLHAGVVGQPSSSTFRDEMTKTAVELLELTAKYDHVVLAGDFNHLALGYLEWPTSEPWLEWAWSPAYDLLMEAGFTDVVKTMLPDVKLETAPGFDPALDPAHDFDARIDWILTRGFEPLEAEVSDPRMPIDGRRISDHRPVRALIRRE